MSVPHPGGNPNANLYAQLKRDVLDRQDEDHPDLGRTHFRYSVGDEEDRWGITFEHETPSLIHWEIVEDLLEEVRPNYRYTNEEP